MAAIAVVALFLVLGPVPATSAATTPVSIDCSDSPGLFLNAPGKYTLTEAVVACASNTIVTIAASNVTFDLGGRVIDGNDTNTACVFVVGLLSNVKVTNGTVRDCDKGVLMGATSSTISGVTAISADVAGIDGGSGNTITGNTATRNVQDGITAGSNTLLTKNIATANATGIAVGNNNTVSTNTATGNSDIGIETGDGNAVAKNSLVGNDHYGLFVRDNNAVSGNRAIGNGFDGIVAAPFSGPIANTTIKSNVADGNGDRGIAIGAESIGPDTSVVSNTADGNGDQGISIVVNTGSPSGQGKNEAAGNAVDPQCDANLCAS